MPDEELHAARRCARGFCVVDHLAWRAGGYLHRGMQPHCAMVMNVLIDGVAAGGDSPGFDAL